MYPLRRFREAREALVVSVQSSNWKERRPGEGDAPYQNPHYRGWDARVPMWTRGTVAHMVNNLKDCNRWLQAQSSPHR